jgi:hypothetical protein
MYKKGIYFSRPKVKTFKNRKSSHIENAKRMYNVKNVSTYRAVIAIYQIRKQTYWKKMRA